MTKESINNEIDKKSIDTSAMPSLKSAKNMAGYAEDKEIDPKLLKVGELVREAQGECMDDGPCSDDELMANQEKREEILEKNRLLTGK